MSMSLRGFVFVCRRYEPVRKAAVDVELGVEIFAYLVLPVRRFLLFPIVELKAALELSECLIDGDHDAFLQ